MPALRTRDTAVSSKPLDVLTSSPPPQLNVVSPTPRALSFSFPTNHALNARHDKRSTLSPSSSSSPFEPDLAPLSILSHQPVNISRTLTPPSVTSRLSPISPSTSTTSSSSVFLAPSLPALATSSRRRKSAAEIDADSGLRRPKRGDGDYIKRPENAFILFRRKCCEDRDAAMLPTEEDEEEASTSASKKTKKQRQADLSKTISQQWKSLSHDERKYWEQLAKEKKKEHEAMYPNYVYRPQRARDKDGNLKPRKPRAPKNPVAAAPTASTETTPTPATTTTTTTEEEDAKLRKHHTGDLGPPLSIVVPTGLRHGRSASMPTPPSSSSATILQFPNVYHHHDPLSPGLTRRASHPGYAEEYAPFTETVPEWPDVNSEGYMPWIPFGTGAMSFEGDFDEAGLRYSSFAPFTQPSMYPPASFSTPQLSYPNLLPTQSQQTHLHPLHLSPSTSSTCSSGPSSPLSVVSSSWMSGDALFAAQQLHQQQQQQQFQACGGIDLDMSMDLDMSSLSAPTNVTDGMSFVDFEAGQDLTFASLAWENANPVWGPNSPLSAHSFSSSTSSTFAAQQQQQRLSPQLIPTEVVEQVEEEENLSWDVEEVAPLELGYSFPNDANKNVIDVVDSLTPTPTNLGQKEGYEYAFEGSKIDENL